MVRNSKNGNKKSQLETAKAARNVKKRQKKRKETARDSKKWQEMA